MNENKLYLSFTTFHSLVQEQFTEAIDIYPEEIINSLNKLSKSKEYKDISLYHWVSAEGLKNKNPIPQHIMRGYTIIVDEGYRDKKERIRQVSRKFLYDIIGDCDGNKNESIMNYTQNDRNDVFLFNFLIFFTLYQDFGSSGLKIELGDVKQLSFYCEIKKEGLVTFNDKKVADFNRAVEMDRVNKLYLSTIFTIFQTKPDVLDNHYKSLYFYDLALIQYKLSYCVSSDDNGEIFFDPEKNKIPVTANSDGILHFHIFFEELKMSDQYSLYCDKLGQLAKHISFGLEYENIVNLDMSAQEYGSLIIDHFAKEAHSSNNKEINNIEKLKSGNRTASRVKDLYAIDRHKKVDHSYDLKRLDGSKLTLGDVAMIIYFYEHSIAAICLHSSFLRSSLSDLNKLREMRRNTHAEFIKKLYVEMATRYTNHIQIGETKDKSCKV
ncbi:hypothetical protein [uncultured Tolumonas sp.]|uniref:hypothetical protein n=1 Tax=uncultured Tolumonas sp. TaxID=263765 RepID=UPI002A0A7CA5|nr:hypothetical protein [uncultured Tolumonas sp.]